jgi:CelD/BcsL family acetyltransferase involved in cellulose biosynthesis
MAIRFVGRKDLGRSAWDDLVDRCSEAWLWHRYDYLSALEVWPGRRDLSFAAVSPEGEALALFPAQLAPYLRIARIFRFPVLDSQGGPALANNGGSGAPDDLRRSLVGHGLALARAHRTAEMRLSASRLAPAYAPDIELRYDSLPDLQGAEIEGHTWMVDLTEGREAVWKGMQGRARTAVRKAEKSGVSVRWGESRGDLESYYRLHRETYERTGACPHPKEYFTAIWTNFVERGLARFLFAEADGEIVAAQNFAVYKGAAVYWTGAATSEALRVGANSLLQWRAIEWMLEADLRLYEVGDAASGPSDTKARRLSDFKRSFGGRLAPVPRVRFDTSGRLLTGLRAAKKAVGR